MYVCKIYRCELHLYTCLKIVAGTQNLYKWYCDCQWRLISMLPFVLASSGKTHFEGLDGLNEVKNVPTSPLNGWRGNPHKFVAFIFLNISEGWKSIPEGSLGWKDIEKGADYSVRTGGCLEGWWQNHDRHGLARNPGDEIWERRWFSGLSQMRCHKSHTISCGNFTIIWHFLHQPRKSSTRPPDVHTIIAHQVYAGESYPVGLWVPTWVAGRMTSALLLGWTPCGCLQTVKTCQNYSKLTTVLETFFQGPNGFWFLKKKILQNGKISGGGTRFFWNQVPHWSGTIWKGENQQKTIRKSCNSSCWRPNVFQCQQTFVVFQSPSTKSSWIFFGALKPTILVAQWTERLQILIEERLGLNVRIGEGPRRLVAVRWWPGWVTWIAERFVPENNFSEQKGSIDPLSDPSLQNGTYFLFGGCFLWFLVSTDKLLHGHRIDLGRRYNIRIPTMPHRPFQTAYFSKSNSCNQNAFFFYRIPDIRVSAVCGMPEEAGQNIWVVSIWRALLPWPLTSIPQKVEFAWAVGRADF